MLPTLELMENGERGPETAAVREHVTMHNSCMTVTDSGGQYSTDVPILVLDLLVLIIDTATN